MKYAKLITALSKNNGVMQSIVSVLQGLSDRPYSDVREHLLQHFGPPHIASTLALLESSQRGTNSVFQYLTRLKSVLGNHTNLNGSFRQSYCDTIFYHYETLPLTEFATRADRLLLHQSCNSNYASLKVNESPSNQRLIDELLESGDDNSRQSLSTVSILESIEISNIETVVCLKCPIPRLLRRYLRLPTSIGIERMYRMLGMAVPLYGQ